MPPHVVAYSSDESVIGPPGWLFGLSSEKRDRHAYEVEPGVISLSAEAKQRIYNLR